MREKFVLNVQVKSISVLFTRNPYNERCNILRRKEEKYMDVLKNGFSRMFCKI